MYPSKPLFLFVVVVIFALIVAPTATGFSGAVGNRVSGPALGPRLGFCSTTSNNERNHSAQLYSSQKDSDEEKEKGLGQTVKKGVTFGLENAFSIVDAVIWATLSVSLLLYFLGYTFEIDKENGFQVRVESIEQARMEKQL